MYGVIFITLGNLSGNAYAFGLYALEAAGVAGNDAAVRGLAVMGLTFACVLHALWRKGGIVLNNLLAFVKVSILLVIIVIGFAASAGASFGNVRIYQSGLFLDNQALMTAQAEITNADFGVNRVPFTGRPLTPKHIVRSPISIPTLHFFILVTTLPTTPTRCSSLLTPLVGMSSLST